MVRTESQVSPLKALGILGAVIIVVAGFIALVALFDNHEAWAGFLFLLHWSMAEGMKPEALTRSITGSLVGLGAASLLVVLPPVLGATAGGLLALAVILALVYVQIRGQAQVAVNMATMLFLTAGTIPHVQAQAELPQILLSLLLGIAYFGGLALALGWISRRRATAPSSAL